MQIELDKEKIKTSPNNSTLVVFKIFNGKTPNTLTRKLFRRNNNIFPLSIKGSGTKVILGDNEEGVINNQECLIYYYFIGGYIPPKIELDNVLHIYRQGLDSEFDNVEYFNVCYIDNVREPKILNEYWSGYMVDILNDFIKNPEKYNL